MRPLLIALSALMVSALLLLAGCNGVADGSSDGVVTPTPTPAPATRAVPAAANNIATVVVDAGPPAVVSSSTRSLNVPFVTVTVCQPGSSTNCATIDHVLVDTGSTGLRLVASAMGSISLPTQNVSTPNGSGVLTSCLNFADGEIWGPVKKVDLSIAGEKASNIAVQIIGDSSYPDSTVPNACSLVGSNENSVAALGANGVLGVSPLRQDCGTACANSAIDSLYYVCVTPTDCRATTVATANQISNPVAFFNTDNNGVALSMPSLSDTGAGTATGALVFGIGTQSNNGLISEKVLDATGTYTPISYNGTTYANSFVDSGSNLYFLPSNINLTRCSASGLTTYFCPSTQQTLALTVFSATQATSTTASINIGNAANLTSNNDTHALNNIGTINSAIPNSIDLGLPFFYGRWVFNALEDASTSGGTGPYVAF